MPITPPPLFRREVKSAEDYISKVGNTPLVRLNGISDEIKRNILVKLEFLNPSGSIKDRAGVYLVQDAIQNKGLKPGGTLVDGTAGNTGVSLCAFAKLQNYKVVLFVPSTLIQDKVDKLTSYGAEIRKIEIDPKDSLHINVLAAEYARSLDNGVHVDQMNNLNNQRAHFENTGPEIWKQTNGKIDAFVSGSGTGGTFSGTTKYLKQVSDGKVKAIIADREGSGLDHYIRSHGESFKAEGESFIEGVGKLALPGNLKDVLSLADGSYRVLDSEVIPVIYRLIDEENLRVGGSSGMNITTAIKYAKSLPEGSTVVTVSPDDANNYASKLFNKEWLVEKGYWAVIPDHLKKYATYIG
ncbi:unnamed protein product [Ambrosiozyma monospora]|uniref:Unnamed protein product n=1 Tax=Ambrosiozyma monospora TaxID=43982 RepID=A0ACB5T2G4_AMBMO|nr:unnamed protein product [Ambrosiozyma monospora]